MRGGAAWITDRAAIRHSKGAYLIYGLLLLVALAGSRLSFRLFGRFIARQAERNSYGKTQVLIYGAGYNGRALYEACGVASDLFGYKVVGFIDDEPRKHGARPAGLRVKSKDAWAGSGLDGPLEIWIPSDAVSNAQALAAKRLFGDDTTAKRISVLWHDVESGSCPVDDEALKSSRPSAEGEKTADFDSVGASLPPPAVNSINPRSPAVRIASSNGLKVR
jgi:hypothetical protein